VYAESRFTGKGDHIQPLMPESLALKVDSLRKIDHIQLLMPEVDSLRKVDHIQPLMPEVDPMNTVILSSRLCRKSIH
ncbi:hypothetical protein A2U01_0008445, partial [Trifolium medium]|nr:hypothetical protein [Trifolium medium]